MSQQTVATRVEREPAWSPTLTPYIVVSDARRAMDWYVEVFGGSAAASSTSTRMVAWMRLSVAAVTGG